MTTLTKPPTDSGPAEGNMRRDIGVVGLLFASVGSIIGSGWLFGALNATVIAGPAAVFSWLIGAFLIVLIGLVRGTRDDVPDQRRRRAVPAPVLRLVRELQHGFHHLGR